MTELAIPRLTDSLKDVKVDAVEPLPGHLRFSLTLEPEDRTPAIRQLLSGPTAAVLQGRPVQIQADTVSGCSGLFQVTARCVAA